MTRTMQQTHEEAWDWVMAIPQKHPTLTPTDLARLWDTPTVSMALASFRATYATGNLSALDIAAKGWCMAWHTALKGYQPPSSPPPPPVPKATAYGTYHSPVLGGTFRVCATKEDATAAMANGEVAYVAAEIWLLAKLKQAAPETFPARLRWLHQVKATFGGFLDRDTISRAKTTKSA